MERNPLLLAIAGVEFLEEEEREEVRTKTQANDVDS
jgi:hypothetical protein